MYEFKKTGKVFISKFFRTGPSSYKKRIYRAVVSQRLKNTGLTLLTFVANIPVLLTLVSQLQTKRKKPRLFIHHKTV